MSQLIQKDISSEAYREVVCPATFCNHVYHIDDPQTMWFRPGGSTIRILDKTGMVHLVPGPGYLGAIHRWQPRDATQPVQF